MLILNFKKILKLKKKLNKTLFFFFKLFPSVHFEISVFSNIAINVALQLILPFHLLFSSKVRAVEHICATLYGSSYPKTFCAISFSCEWLEIKQPVCLWRERFIFSFEEKMLGW